MWTGTVRVKGNERWGWCVMELGIVCRAGQVGIHGWHPLASLLLYENQKIRGESEATRAGIWPQQRTARCGLGRITWSSWIPAWIPVVAH